MESNELVYKKYLVPNTKNIASEPLIKRENVLVPPLHMKLGIWSNLQKFSPK